MNHPNPAPFEAAGTCFTDEMPSETRSGSSSMKTASRSVAYPVHLRSVAASVALPPPPARTLHFFCPLSGRIHRAARCGRSVRPPRLQRGPLTDRISGGGRWRALVRGSATRTVDLPDGDAAALRVARKRLRILVRRSGEPSGEQRKNAELAERHGDHAVPRELQASARRLRAHGGHAMPRAVRVVLVVALRAPKLRPGARPIRLR